MKYKLLRQDFEEYREALLDEAEMCLRAKIRRGDTSAMIFFLKCVGKQRGYIEYEKQQQKKGSALDDWIFFKFTFRHTPPHIMAYFSQYIF